MPRERRLLWDLKPVFCVEISETPPTVAFRRFQGLEIIDPEGVFADRTIKIFVSSTFSEFVAEREAIALNVMPELQKRASSRGVDITAIDLRWGVTRAESASGTAVRRCLNEVHAAYPFFIGMMESTMALGCRRTRNCGETGLNG
jgi:hypothetical protein